MDVRNCKGCGKLFNYLSGPPLCPACIRELDKKFSDVKKYIYDNPGASIQQVADDNEVSIALLKRWVREERLTFSEDSAMGIECEGCGTMIRTGRFCAACKDKMTNNFSNMYREPVVEQKKPAKDSPKMRFLDHE